VTNTVNPVLESYAELLKALDAFSTRAVCSDGSELMALWPGLERRLLSRMRADEGSARPLEGSPTSEQHRIRNLAWEVGVSVDLQAVHLRALETLSRLVRERAERVDGIPYTAERPPRGRPRMRLLTRASDTADRARTR
jgi:hypothetical protein